MLATPERQAADWGTRLRRLQSATNGNHRACDLKATTAFKELSV